MLCGLDTKSTLVSSRILNQSHLREGETPAKRGSLKLKINILQYGDGWGNGSALVFGVNHQRFGEEIVFANSFFY